MRRGVNWSTTTCPPSAGSCAVRRAATIGFPRWSRRSCKASSSGCAVSVELARSPGNKWRHPMYIFKNHVSRRTVLKGVGATIALPLLDAMNPAATAWAETAAGSSPRRLAFIGFPHGAIMDRWSPAQTGTGYQMSHILQPLAPFRQHLTIVSAMRNNQGEKPEPHEDLQRTWLTYVMPWD